MATTAKLLEERVMRRNKPKRAPNRPAKSLAHLSARWNVEKEPLAGSGPPPNGWVTRARTALGEWYVRRRVAGMIAALLIVLLLLVAGVALRYSSAIFGRMGAARDTTQGR